MRKFMVFLAAASLTFLLFMTALSSIVALTFTPAHIKSWLRESNVYNTIVDDILEQSKDTLAQSSGGDQEIVNQPAVQEAAKKAFSPEFLQDSTEKFIDGVTPWLEGKTPTPTFNIEVASVKAAFAQNIASYARDRYASLPVCPKGQEPDTSDILTVSCQVPGVSIESQIQKSIDEVVNSKDFLPDATVTAANLTTGEGDNKRPLFESIEQVPKVYRWARFSPFIFGVLALLAAAVIIFLSTEKRKGTRRVGVSLAFAGGVLLTSLWLLAFGISKAEAEITKSISENEGLETTGVALLKEIQHSLNGIALVFGIGFLVFAIALFIYLFATKDKKPDSTTKASGNGKSKKEAAKVEEGAKKPDATKVETPKPPTRLVQ